MDGIQRMSILQCHKSVAIPCLANAYVVLTALNTCQIVTCKIQDFNQTTHMEVVCTSNIQLQKTVCIQILPVCMQRVQLWVCIQSVYRVQCIYHIRRYIHTQLDSWIEQMSNDIHSTQQLQHKQSALTRSTCMDQQQ